MKEKEKTEGGRGSKYAYYKYLPIARKIKKVKAEEEKGNKP